MVMKQLILSIVMLMATITVSAQDIKLPAPDLTQKSLPVVEALAQRHSVREYADKELTLQELSNLCWAACGESRDSEHITAASAMNRQEVRLFVFTKDGVCEYLAHENLLKHVVDGDQRKLVAGPQDFVEKAPVCLVMVVDYDKFGMKDHPHATEMCCVDVGNVSENVNLYCQAVGLATVPRGTMDAQAIVKLLGLGESQVPVLNNPVGWPK